MVKGNLMADPRNVILQRNNVYLSQKLNQVLKLEEIKWSQKARQTWTQLGDKNNRYFQTLALDRRRKHKIWKKRDSEGIWYDDQMEISKVFINDFSKRFTYENPRINHELFDTFSPCISEEENRELKKSQKKKFLQLFCKSIV